MGMFYKVDSPRLVDYSYKFPFKEAMIASNQLNKGIDDDIADINKLKINAKAYPGDSIGVQQVQQDFNDSQSYLIQQVKEHPSDKSYMPGMLAARANVNNFNAIKGNLKNNKIQWDRWNTTNKGNAIVSADQLRKFAIDKNGQTFIKDPTTGRYEITKTTLDLPVLSNANYDDEVKKLVSLTTTRVNGGSIKPTSVELNIGGEKMNLLKTGNYVNTTRDFWKQVENSGISKDEVLDKIIKSDNNLEKDLKVYQEYDNYYSIDPNSDNSKVKQYKDHLSDALALQTGLIKKNDWRSSNNYSSLGGGRSRNNSNTNSYNQSTIPTKEVRSKPAITTSSNGTAYHNWGSQDNASIASLGSVQSIIPFKLKLVKDVNSLNPPQFNADEEAIANGIENNQLYHNGLYTLGLYAKIDNSNVEQIGTKMVSNIRNSPTNSSITDTGFFAVDNNGKLIKDNSSHAARNAFVTGFTNKTAEYANDGTQTNPTKSVSDFKNSNPTVQKSINTGVKNFKDVLFNNVQNLPGGISFTLSFNFNDKIQDIEITTVKGEPLSVTVERKIKKWGSSHKTYVKGLWKELSKAVKNKKDDSYQYTYDVTAQGLEEVNNSTLSTPNVSSLTTSEKINGQKVSSTFSNIRITTRAYDGKNQFMQMNNSNIVNAEIVRMNTPYNAVYKTNNVLNNIADNHVEEVNYGGEKCYAIVFKSPSGKKYAWINKSAKKLDDKSALLNTFINVAFNGNQGISVGPYKYSINPASHSISYIP